MSAVQCHNWKLFRSANLQWCLQCCVTSLNVVKCSALQRSALQCDVEPLWSTVACSVFLHSKHLVSLMSRSLQSILQFIESKKKYKQGLFHVCFRLLKRNHHKTLYGISWMTSASVKMICSNILWTWPLNCRFIVRLKSGEQVTHLLITTLYIWWLCCQQM